MPPANLESEGDEISVCNKPVTPESTLALDEENANALRALVPNGDAHIIAKRLHMFESRVDEAESGDLISTTFYNVETFPAAEKNLQNVPSLDRFHPNLFQEALNVLTEWRSNLKVGDKVDASDGSSADNMEKNLIKWFPAVVREVAPAGAKVRDVNGEKVLSKAGVKMHFEGFTSKYDLYMEVDTRLIMPTKSYRLASKILRSKKMEERKRKKMEEEEARRKSEEEAKKILEAEAEPVKKSRSGRAIKNVCKPAPKRKADSRENKEMKRGAGKQGQTSDEDLTSWVCNACFEVENVNDPDAPLVICEGGCERPFHLPCVGLSRVPEGKWLCGDCIKGSHKCVVCEDYGADNEEGGVFMCSKPDCGLFYHESCLSQLNSHVDPDDPTKFICPAHMCWTCGDVVKGDPHKQTKQGALFRCLYCPNAYHVDCISPLANFHELAIVCHEHRDRKLPYFDTTTSVLKSSNKRKKKIGKYDTAELIGGVQVGDSNGRFIQGWTLPQLRLPMQGIYLNERQIDELAWRLPIRFQQEVYAKPPPYSHVNGLKYLPGKDERPEKMEESDVCKCVGNCGENCINRCLKIECVWSGAYKNCNCGEEDCGNRRLSKKQIARCRPMRETGKGWGLITLDGVQPGDLVGEYVGEVLKEEQISERLRKHELLKPNDPNFYIMELEGGWYIDAREKGNLSRFINHSCDPNCKLEKTNVGGYLRIAIICIRPVEPGDFLCYDYQFDTEHGDKFKCACGAVNCRGTMKGGKGTEVVQEEKKKSKQELLKVAKAKNERDRLYIAKVQKEQAERCNLVDLTVPGARSQEESVLTGPKEIYRDFLQENKVAMWRNVKMGWEGVQMKGREILYKRGNEK